MLHLLVPPSHVKSKEMAPYRMLKCQRLTVLHYFTLTQVTSVSYLNTNIRKKKPCTILSLFPVSL